MGDLLESEQLESIRRWKGTSNNSALYPVIAYSTYTDIYNRNCLGKAQDMGQRALTVNAFATCAVAIVFVFSL